MSKITAETAASVVVFAGIVAALHIGKLPPAMLALQDALGITLLQAGFLLSAVPLAGMVLGVFVGLSAETLGLRRSMVFGLSLLGIAGVVGGCATTTTGLLCSRVLEGFGFLLVVLPAPGLIRRLVPSERLALKLGMWGAYMPIGTALALASGSWVVNWLGWRGWWWVLAGLSIAMACCVLLSVPRDRQGGDLSKLSRPDIDIGSWPHRLMLTLTSRGPWLVALIFATYSSQWLAVIGFLPSIYSQAGVSALLSGVLTAIVSLANVLGNVGAGQLLYRGFSAKMLLRVAFFSMASCTLVAFCDATNDFPILRFVSVFLFSAVGGMIPAVLFSLAVLLAPGEETISTTVGWTQQCSSMGQFLGPPLVAWLASAAGGWGWSWVITCAASLLGFLLVSRLPTHGRRAVA